MSTQSAAPSPVLIGVQNVSKVYRIYANPMQRLKAALGLRNARFTEFEALSDVTLAVRRGEAIGLIGRNGAGKSTLLQIMSGVAAATIGTTQINGRIAPLLELGTSFNPEFTGIENISLAGLVLGLSEQQVTERTESIVRFADIGEHIHHPVRTYSSGMYARLAFSIAIHVDADVLILDEILAVGDIRFIQKCMRFIREFRERGTLLLVSHDIGAVLAICDRAVWLDRGRIIDDDAPERVVPLFRTFMASGDPGLDAISFRRRVTPDEVNEAETAAARDLDETNAGVPGEPDCSVRFSGFNWGAKAYGQKRGMIVDARWEDASSRPTQVLRGGAPVTLVIEVDAQDELLSPIVGFGVLDRLGQTVFAWDTSKNPTLLGRRIQSGQRFQARFRFRFPYLAGGIYSLILGVSDGTPDSHTQEHRLFNSISFEVTWSTVAQGLIGVPIETSIAELHAGDR
jgi:lipopolysaccharide transport system ATP-binding protein